MNVKEEQKINGKQWRNQHITSLPKKKKMIQNGDIKASEDTLEGKKRRAGETKEEGEKKKRQNLHTHTHGLAIITQK